MASDEKKDSEKRAEEETAVERRRVFCSAALTGNADTLARLIDEGMSVNTKDSLGYSAVNLAAWEGQAKTLRLLLERGAEVDVPDLDGSTALMKAVEHKHEDAALLLLEHGASVSVLVDEEGNTALALAKKGGLKNIVARMTSMQLVQGPLLYDCQRETHERRMAEALPKDFPKELVSGIASFLVIDLWIGQRVDCNTSKGGSAPRWFPGTVANVTVCPPDPEHKVQVRMDTCYPRLQWFLLADQAVVPIHTHTKKPAGGGGAANAGRFSFGAPQGADEKQPVNALREMLLQRVQQQQQAQQPGGAVRFQFPPRAFALRRANGAAANAAANEPKLPDAIVASLVDMGFEAEKIQRAFAATKAVEAQPLVDWMLQH